MYYPDVWVVLRIESKDSPVIYKVLTGSNGGYLHGSGWRINSGITKVEKEDEHYLFHGVSGSVYVCHQDSYRMNLASSGIYNQIMERHAESVTLLPEDTDFLNLDLSK